MRLVHTERRWCANRGKKCISSFHITTSYFCLCYIVLHENSYRCHATDLRIIAACFATSFILCCLKSMSGTQDQMS
ncbi:unnamed protein product [Ixodes persulcatus]